MAESRKNCKTPTSRPKSAYELHRTKVEKASPAIDVNPPKDRPHVLRNAKRQQLERERQARIAEDNFILVRKLQSIMHRKPVKEESSRLVWKESTCIRSR